MIAQKLLVLGLVGVLLMEVIGSPVSFPTESPQSQDLDYSAEGDKEAEGRFNHREKKKRKRQRLSCLLALQQQNNRYRREAAQGDGRTLLWGGLNYYNTDIHVYNGGYGGSRPSYAPSQAISPSNPCEGLPIFSNFPKPSLGNLPSLPSLPNFSNIGNEIIHVFNPGTSFPGSLPSTGSSSSSSSSSSGVKPNPGGGPSLGGGGPSPGTGDGDTDNTSEDYDYSDGGDSDSDSNRIKRRRRPTQASSFLQPVDRYLDQFLFRPIDRTFQRIVRWF